MKPLRELAQIKALVKNKAVKSKKKKAINNQVESGGILNKIKSHPNQAKSAKIRVGKKFFLRLITVQF
jgi:hypothetical protein